MADDAQVRNRQINPPLSAPTSLCGAHCGLSTTVQCLLTGFAT